MTRPNRTLATLFALLGSATMMAGAASAQSYQSPPAYHVPTQSYGTTTYQPVYAAPAQTGTVVTQTHGGQVLYRAAPVPSSVSTQTYIAPAAPQPAFDSGVTYAPYYGTPQPQPVYRQPAPAPVPVYRAPQPVQTWVRPPQPVYVPRPAPQFGAPAVFGGLFGAAILGSILLNDDDDHDRRRYRNRDDRGDRYDGRRFQRGDDRARRQDLTREERRAARRQGDAGQLTREERRAARQQGDAGQAPTREERRAARQQGDTGQAPTREERRAARQQGGGGQERNRAARQQQPQELTREQRQAERLRLLQESRNSYPASWRSNN